MREWLKRLFAKRVFVLLSGHCNDGNLFDKVEDVFYDEAAAIDYAQLLPWWRTWKVQTMLVR